MLDQRHQRARSHIDPLEHTFPIFQHLIGQPMISIFQQQGLMRQKLVRIALRMECPKAKLHLVEAQMQDRIIQFTRKAQHIGLGTLVGESVHILGRIVFRAMDHDRGLAACAIYRDLNSGIGHRAVFAKAALQGCQCDPLGDICLFGIGCEFFGAGDDGFVKFGIGHNLIHQAPVFCALALHAFFDRTENIGTVAAHLALVGHTGQATCPGKHRQKRDLGQRHRRRAVIGQHDIIAGQSQLIPAARTCTFHGRNILLARIFFRRLKGIAGLIGEFTKINLMAMRRAT